MDRQIVYAGQVPLDTDVLNAEKNAMLGIGALAQALMGTSTQLVGLACAPTSPASMQVQVGPGAIYSLQFVDPIAYGSLAADNVNQVMKQGQAFGNTLLSCPAPVTAGQSINYLVQFAFGESDGNATVLPYYNSSNPAVSYNGPNNTGTANATQRQDRCTIAVKAGASAPTGTQTTPAPDAGYVAGYVVTVAYGAASIVAGNISVAPGAPFLFPAAVLYAALAGANTFSALNTFNAGIQLAPRVDVASASTVVLATNYVRITGTTTITAITLPSGGFCDVLFGGALQLTNSASLIVAGGANLTVAAGDTARFYGEAGGVVRMVSYNPVSGLSPGALISVSYITASTTFNAVANARFYEIEVQGAGGSGAFSANPNAVFGGGGGGGYARKRVSAAAFGASQTVTIGAGGASVSTAGTNGNAGGTTSVGALLSATGGGGGVFSTSPGTNASGVGGTGSGGDLNCTGGGGSTGATIAPSGGPNISFGGGGGDAFYGGGGVFAGNNATASTTLAGGNYGGGGSGSNSGSGSGPGAPGLVVIRAYA